MTEERSFLNDDGVYVSNTRVVIQGTAYATANITSVRKLMTPAKNGCAIVMVIFGALGAVGGLTTALGVSDGEWTPFIMSAVLLIAGIAWFRSLRPSYSVMLATAGGERQGLTSKDEGVVDRVTAAIADAIVHRG